VAYIVKKGMASAVFNLLCAGSGKSDKEEKAFPKNKVSEGINKNSKENQKESSHTLRQYLCSRLPDYMVPAVFVAIDTFPLTASGKIDRQQLPDPCLESLVPGNFYVPPRDALECRLTGIWEKLLKVKPIGLTDDFFKLGGYSLLAVQLFSRIKEELGYSLPASVLFMAPTVEQLTAVIRQQGNSPVNSAIIPLQTSGNGIPVFLMHHADSVVIDYQELVQQMNSKLQCPKLQTALSGLRKDTICIKGIASFIPGPISSTLRTLQPFE
jgi:hypothetical protein